MSDDQVSLKILYHQTPSRSTGGLVQRISLLGVCACMQLGWVPDTLRETVPLIAS